MPLRLGAEVQALPRAIFFDIHDLDSVAMAKRDLEAYARDSETGEPTETPISVARDVKRLWETETPRDQVLADMVEGVQELLAEKRAREAAARRGALRTALAPKDMPTMLKFSDYLEATKTDAPILSDEDLRIFGDFWRSQRGDQPPPAPTS